MKSKKMNYVVMSIFIALLLCASWSMVGFTNNKMEMQDLSFKGKADKEAFILGEPVKVEFEFVNESETAVTIPGLGIEDGSLKIFIANKDGEYKRYQGSGWGRLIGSPLTLKPKQSHKYKEAVILWNGKPNVSHLNEDAAKRVLTGKITTEYAFPEPGVYFIKGVSSIHEIESEPIKIVIYEPVGDDLEVWNQIKGNKEIAYLMQNSSFNTSEEAEKEKLTTQVEQIFVQYPNSTYSSYLKSSLEKYREKEARRNESYKNMRKGQKPE